MMSTESEMQTGFSVQGNSGLTINNFFDPEMDVSGAYVKFLFFLILSNFSFQSSNNMDFPDLDFIYSDTDSYANEIAELYSYTENNEFQQNVKVYPEISFLTISKKKFNFV